MTNRIFVGNPEDELEELEFETVTDAVGQRYMEDDDEDEGKEKEEDKDGERHPQCPEHRTRAGGVAEYLKPEAVKENGASLWPAGL